MIRKLRSLTLLFFFTAILFSLAMTKSKGKGKWVIRVEAQTENFSVENEQLTEKIYKARLINFGIKEEDILLKSDGKKIDVEISEISNYKPNIIDGISKLLQSNGHLSFWETYSLGELSGQLHECMSADPIRKERLNDLIAISEPDYHSCCLFSVLVKDTVSVDSIMSYWLSAKKLPQNLRLSWTTKPVWTVSDNKNTLATSGLIALKTNTFGKASIANPIFTDVHVDTTHYGILISMTMDPPTAYLWSKITKASIGKSVAIVLDGSVYTYPTVQSEIPNGISSMTGNFTVEEANEMVALLKTEPLPCPMRITEQKFTR